MFWEHGAPQGPWCSSLALGSFGDATWDVGARAPAGHGNPGHRGPTQRRRHCHPQLLLLVTGPEIGRWQVNIHLCVKDVSLV